MFKNKYVVNSNFISENRDKSNFFVIDARGDMLKVGDYVYDNAIILDWKEFTYLNNGVGSEFVGLYFDKETLKNKFLKYGIEENSIVLVYINTEKNSGMGEDGRFKFLLNFCGIETYILDGGINEVLKTPFTRKIKCEQELKKSVLDFEQKPCLDYEKSVTTSTLFDMTKDENIKILDVRYKSEYDGEIVFGEKFGGHIVNSISFPYTELYDDNGYLLSNEEIESKIFKCNISKENIVVVYCTSGIRASIVYEILTMLGFNTLVYDESFARWCIVGDYEV